MINLSLRPYVEKTISPIAKVLLKMGFTPNVITVIGALLSAITIVVGFLTNNLVLLAILVAIFCLVDLLDGAMARANGGGTAFGAVLDATCDRFIDGILFGMVAWWGLKKQNSELVFALALATLVLSFAISYIKARAEANRIVVTGGLIERAERLIIGLLAIGLQGLGIPHMVLIGLIILVIGSVITVFQRFLTVYRNPISRNKFEIK